MGPTSAPHGAPARTETWKCRGCGATNRASAQWCGQCFAAPATPAAEPAPQSPEAPPITEAEPVREGAPTSLEEALLLLAKRTGGATATAPTARQPDSASSATAAPLDSRPVDGAAEMAEADAGSFSVRAEGITWACKWCEARNPLAEQRCSVCGAGFGEILKEEKLQVARDPGTVALISLFFPGAGHAYMGRWGQAVARAVISLWALLVCFFAGVQGGRGMMLAVVFGVIALALWVIAAHDAYREASGSSALALIKSNHFLYLVLGLLGLQISMVFFVALNAR
ncbi:MAG: hypothetical protein LC799_27855 [Actinobacteria bacterium]|nr:hypothetical protein [Actinomycetota bacterium]